MGKESSSRIEAYETTTLEGPEISRPVGNNSKYGMIVAIGIAIVTIAAIAVLAQTNAGADVHASGTKSNEVAVPTLSLLSAMKVIDGNGKLVSNGGVSESDTITFSGYYFGGYTGDLQAMIDGLPLYVDGSAKTISGLPEGTHTLVIVESGNGVKPQSFTWSIE